MLTKVKKKGKILLLLVRNVRNTVIRLDHFSAFLITMFVINNRETKLKSNTRIDICLSKSFALMTSQYCIWCHSAIVATHKFEKLLCPIFNTLSRQCTLLSVKHFYFIKQGRICASIYVPASNLRESFLQRRTYIYVFPMCYRQPRAYICIQSIYLTCKLLK